MPTPYYLHDLNAEREYQLDWQDWLGDEVLTASTWTPADVTGGVEVSSVHPATFTPTLTTAWLKLASAVTLGQTYKVVNHVTTATRSEDQTIALVAHQK